MQGTWKTTGGGGPDVAPVLAVIVAAIVLFAMVGGAAQAVAEIPLYVWILGTVMIVTILSAGVVLLVRVRRAETARVAAWVQQRHALPRPAVPARNPGGVEQHVHLHLHGDVGQDAVAGAFEAVRSQGNPASVSRTVQGNPSPSQEIPPR